MQDVICPIHKCFLLFNIFSLSKANQSAILINSLPMESDTSSSLRSPSHPRSNNGTPPPTDAFLITRKDSEILSEFLDEFQDGDGEICTKIIANAMAAVFLARPDGDPFNKSKASKVRFVIF
jgi:hypothetical protein